MGNWPIECFNLEMLVFSVAVSFHALDSGRGFPGGAVVKNPPANAGDTGDVGSIPGSGRSPGTGNGNPLQYSCLQNSMDRGAWWAKSGESQKVRHN